ncbi:response regulator [Enterococcus devriesei]|uniref:response regulator n=1 Tax=Enterococcus devriesei TaxID=319970 RepID=UPI0028AC0BDE|nr:response regulator [Enterococcus devriesei]
MNVLIVEDDPMVEFIHRNYLEQAGQFQQIYSASSITDAKELLKEKPIDLILLDIHLKDGNGLELLAQLRRQQQMIEVILITAANEAPAVKEGLHLGVVDYLVKPFTNQRFQESLGLFFKRKQTLQQANLPQEQIDQLLKKPADTPSDSSVKLEKGLSPETLERIKNAAASLKRDFTIQELADASNLSHVSVRKYIQHLEDHQLLTSEVIYTKVGRPYKIYSMKT